MSNNLYGSRKYPYLSLERSLDIFIESEFLIKLYEVEVSLFSHKQMLNTVNSLR